MEDKREDSDSCGNPYGRLGRTQALGFQREFDDDKPVGCHGHDKQSVKMNAEEEQKKSDCTKPWHRYIESGVTHVQSGKVGDVNEKDEAVEDSNGGHVDAGRRGPKA